MKTWGVIGSLVFCVCCTQSVVDHADMELVWSDEFEYSGQPDESKWDYDIGDGCPTLCGWGNNELQHYTQSRENVRVEEGRLVIEAHQDTTVVPAYTSARLVSRHMGDWQYGLVEIKAKLPEGRGTWPAIWMLPTHWHYGGWPRSGEIDVMEHVGYNQGMIYGTVHTDAFNHRKGTQQSDSIRVPDAHSSFHVYAIKWTPDQIDFLLDGKVYNSFKNNRNGVEEWPYDQPFYLLLNVAVGGNWGGKYGVDEHIWPQRMEVDYVRVYQLPEEGDVIPAAKSPD